MTQKNDGSLQYYVHLFGAWQQIEKWWWEQLEERGAEIVEYGEA